MKDEPHKTTKLAAGRERLIFALSLVDQMVDRILFKPMIDVEIRNPREVVSKTGWSPLPEGYRAIYQEFPGEVMAVDKTAWDWTMPGWVVAAYHEMKMEQCLTMDELYSGMTFYRMMEVVGPLSKVRLPTGFEVRQKGIGLMKSGWLLTLSMNSLAQALQHAVAAYSIGEEPPRCWAMGDDFISRSVRDVSRYREELSRTGCIVKHIKNILEFAGFEFTKGGVEPLYTSKHKFLLAYVDPAIEQDVLLAYHLLYSLSENDWLERYRKFAEFPIGNSFKLWALGLRKLELCLDEMEWLRY